MTGDDQVDPPAPKTCARCGAAFGCGAQAGAGGCWCEGAALPAEAAAALREAYDDCLCPACLDAVAARGVAGG